MIPWACLLVLIMVTAIWAVEPSPAPATAPATSPATAPTTAPAGKLERVVVLPDGYAADSAKTWPLWIHLHGNWPRKQGEVVIPQREDVYQAALAAKLPVILVGPQCPPQQGWKPQELSRLLEELLRDYRVDRTRIYLSGGSMGGYGAMDWVVACPKTFAGVIILCGGTASPEAAQLAGTPIWAFHGRKDELVPYARMAQLAQTLLAACARFQLTTYDDLGHDIGKRATADPRFFPWMLEQQRKP